jgi:hypothetical protein
MKEALDNSQPDQFFDYIEGVGTSDIKLWAMFDGATGIGVPSNVRRLYLFLCKNYEPDAEIFMFGFSRGAFTIRSLVGMIKSQGLLPTRDERGNRYCDADLEHLSRSAYRRYRAPRGPIWRRPGDLFRPKHWDASPTIAGARVIRDLLVESVEAYRRLRGRPIYSQVTNRISPTHVEIAFVGLFDTVEAFGVPLEEMRAVIDNLFWPISFKNQKIWRNVKAVRHALSLDDERRTFHPLRVEPEDDEIAKSNPGQIKEVWFSGVHSDVGGGYPDGAAALSPLLWMLGELGDSLVFRSADVKRWRLEASSYGSLHDSREKLSVLYRYEPRDATPKKLDGSAAFAPPLVHHSVVERMAFGHDQYAPTILPGDAMVLLPNGMSTNLKAPKDEVPNEVRPLLRTTDPCLSKALAALSALDTPSDALIERARDQIWWRRLNYVSMIGLIGAFVLLPGYADPLGDWLTEATKGIWLVDYWNGFWGGVGSSLGFIVGMIVPNVATFVAPYLETLRQHPAIFSFVAGSLLIFYFSSVSLKQTIAETVRRAWLRDEKSAAASGAVSETTAASSEPEGELAGGSIASFFRKNSIFTVCYSIFRGYALPIFWAGVMVLLLVVLESRIVFMFRAGAGEFCTATPQDALRSAPDHAFVAAKSEFSTSDKCWASGLLVKKGVPYELKIEIDEKPWLDRTILTDARGFESSDWVFRAGRVLLRWAFNSWFQPIVRIGARGDAEMPLDSVAPSGPNDLIDPKCPGVPKRYENSPEYCALHGYRTAEQCAKSPLEFGSLSPLPDEEMAGAKLAWDNALQTRNRTMGCEAPPAQKIFVGKFTANRDGELFMFVNDMIPPGGVLHFGDFYNNNSGAAKVSLRRTP